MVASRIVKGLRNPNKAFEHIAKKPFLFVDKYFNYGTNVFDMSWDLLIILDACRYDLFVEFAPQHSVYSRLDSVEPTYSIASQTPDWLERTFENTDESLLSQTLYISANGQIDLVDTDGLYGVESVWQYGHDQKANVPWPDTATNEAIRNFRTTDAERYIVHYLQPHAPFLHCAGKYNSIPVSEGRSNNVWKGLKEGKFDQREIWKDYGQNLLLVLDHVETLIKNFDGKVAITADHGNAMGEFGLYGHPGRLAAPPIRRVPWAVTSGLGLDTYEVKNIDEVTSEGDSRDTNPELEQHLRDLGYQT